MTQLRLLPLSLVCVFGLLACDGSEQARQAAPLPDGGAARRIEADVRFLADDLLEGRGTATRGFDLAALYVASEFRKLGLGPIADRGFLQTVPLLSAVRQREGARFSLETAAGPREFAFQDEWLPNANFSESSSEVSAPLVFVGQGVSAPELGRDDFAGIDLKGRIAVLFGNAPPDFPVDERAFHASSLRKLQMLVDHGAIGVIQLRDPKDEQRRPWAQGAANRALPGMRLRDAAGKAVDDFPELRVKASLRADLAAALFEGSGHSFDSVIEALRAGKLQSFALNSSATLAQSTALTSVASSNVVGLLKGSDPSLASEYVVLTAHLDHLGIGAEINGDSIYNGAVDNALGVSIMLEAARNIVQSGRAPQRSLLFVAVTGEEKGLLGAQHFVAEPPVPRAQIVANVNMDMPVLLGDLSDVVPIGIEHSNLQGIVEAAAAHHGIALSPDSKPEETVFVRSDQFAFIRAGIPAVYLNGGVKGRDPHHDGAESLDGFLVSHYHLPNDDVNLPIHYAGAAGLAALNADIALGIAAMSQRPAWNAGDFFGTRFAPKP